MNIAAAAPPETHELPSEAHEHSRRLKNQQTSKKNCGRLSAEDYVLYHKRNKQKQNQKRNIKHWGQNSIETFVQP